MAHHRFSIVFTVTSEIQDSTGSPTSQVPSDATVTDNVNKHLKGLDVGSGYKITDAKATNYTKKLKKT